jgi:hypothetical protein
VLVLSRPGASGTGAAAAGAGPVPPQPTPAPAAADAGIFVSSADEAPSDSDEEDSAAAGDESPVRRQSRAGGKAAAAAAATASASASTIVAAAAAAAGVARFVPLNLEASYVVAIKGYLLKGKDGFDAFRDPSVEVLVDEELGPVLPVAMRNYFRLLSSLSSFQRSEKETKMVRQVTLPRLNRVRKVRVSTDHVAVAAALAATGMPSDASTGGAAHDGFQIGGGSFEDEEANSGVSPASPMSPMSPVRQGITFSSEEGDAALLGATPFAHSIPASPTSFASPSGLALDGALTPASRMQSSSQIDDVAKRAWTEQKRKLRGGAKTTAFALAVNPKTDGRIERV